MDTKTDTKPEWECALPTVVLCPSLVSILRLQTGQPHYTT